jgi:hypothetical protein
VGSNLRISTTFITTVHPCTAPTHSLHSLCVHRGPYERTNARQKRSPTFIEKSYANAVDGTPMDNTVSRYSSNFLNISNGVNYGFMFAADKLKMYLNDLTESQHKHSLNIEIRLTFLNCTFFGLWVFSLQ